MEDCPKINLKKCPECGNVYDTGSIKDIIALIPMGNASRASISIKKNTRGYIGTYFGSAQQVVNLMLKKNNLAFEDKEDICPLQHISKHYRMLLG